MSNITVDVLSESYTTLKQYIPSKDRQEAADTLMSILVDMLSDDDLKEFAATDRALTKAYAEYGYEDETDEEYEDE